MENIFSIYEFINFVVDKVRQGYISPEDCSNALDAGQQEFYRYLLPLYHEFGDDYAATALIPFKLSIPLASDSGGILAYPDDYGNTEAIFENNGATSFNTVMHTELAYALDSELYPIAKYPRYLEEASGIQLYPAVLHNVDYHYLSTPTTPVIGYTDDGNTIIYDPNTSVQLQFSNQYWMQIIQKSLVYVGVNLGEQEVAGLTQLFNQENPQS